MKACQSACCLRGYRCSNNLVRLGRFSDITSPHSGNLEVRPLRADFDHTESRTGVVAGLVPATSIFWRRATIIFLALSNDNRGGRDKPGHDAARDTRVLQADANPRQVPGRGAADEQPLCRSTSWLGKGAPFPACVGGNDCSGREKQLFATEL